MTGLEPGIGGTLLARGAELTGVVGEVGEVGDASDEFMLEYREASTTVAG